MNPIRLSIAALLLLAMPLLSQTKSDGWLQERMETRPDAFESVLRKARELRVQIIYTKIDRDAKNFPHFTTYTYREDPQQYFYPASTVKFPVAMLALEKIHDLKVPGLDARAAMYSESTFPGQQPVTTDTTAEGGVPSVAHYIRKIFVVSDNDAFNRLYAFVGQGEIDRRLIGKGYHARIRHRLESNLTPEQNRTTEAMRFMRHDTLLYRQPQSTSKPLPAGPQTLLGKGYFSGGKLVRKPMDFSAKNFLSLRDNHEMLKAIIFPQAVPEKQRFQVSSEDRKFVLQCMSQLPRETLYPAYYRDTTLTDAWVKYFVFGDKKDSIPSAVRIFNKVGLAYGFVIDNAYIVDLEKGIEFMLSAVIYVNRDGILNDNKYEYDEVAFPFFANLGRLIYDYEIGRQRDFRPNLDEFRLHYDIENPITPRD